MKKRFAGPLLLSMLAGARLAGGPQTPNVRNHPVQRLLNRTSKAVNRANAKALAEDPERIWLSLDDGLHTSGQGWNAQQTALEDVMRHYDTRGIAPQEVFDGVIQSQIRDLPEFDVVAHGILTTALDTFIVPPKTVVVFFNIPGTSTAVGYDDPILSRNTKNRLKSGSATGRKGVATGQSAYAVMNVNGDQIPDVELDFSRDGDMELLGLPRMGLHAATGSNTQRGSWSGGGGGSTTLSRVIREQGPGVYYVVSCRPPGKLNSNYLDRTLQLAEVTQRQRNRQQMYSNADFGKFASSHTKLADEFDRIRRLRRLLWTDAQRNTIYKSDGGYDTTSNELSGMDTRWSPKGPRIFTPPIVLLYSLMSFGSMSFRAGLATRATGAIVRGGSFSEMLLLAMSVLMVSNGNPTTSAKILSGFKLYASRLALGTMLRLLPSDVRRARQKMPKKLQRIGVALTARAKQLEERRRLLRKYGFDTPDPVQLQRLYTFHTQRAGPNTAKRSEIAEAFAFAPARRVRQLPTKLADAIRGRSKPVPKLLPRTTARETKKLLGRWQFHKARTPAEVRAIYDRQLKQHSVWNRLSGKVDPSLIRARNVAMRLVDG